MENRGFALALQNEVSSADSHTRSDFFESSLAEDWVHPQERNSDDDDEDDDEEIPDLTDADIEQLRKEARARLKESEQLTFADVPPALQELIHDLIRRVENTIGQEESEECSFDLRGFIEGRYKYTQPELSSQMAKHLRMLT
jgi:rRNA maturation endonuclease Nob1